MNVRTYVCSFRSSVYMYMYITSFGYGCECGCGHAVYVLNGTQDVCTGHSHLIHTLVFAKTVLCGFAVFHCECMYISVYA